MNRIKWLVILLSVWVPTLLGQEIMHSRYSPGDQFLACMRRVWKKPVFWDRDVELDSIRGMSCASAKQQFLAILADSKLHLLEGTDSAFLLPSKYVSPWTPETSEVDRLPWTSADIVVRIARSPFGRPSRQLTDEQLKEVGRSMLRVMRPIPTERSYRSADHSNDHTAAISVDLQIDVQQLTLGGADSVIGILQSPSGDGGRLIYGEYLGGTLQLIWDSPLFVTGDLRIEYSDANQDGTKDIVVWSVAPANKTSPELVIFDSRGTELTRQDGCMSRFSAFSPQNGVCSISGPDVQLKGKPGWPTEILVGSADGICRRKYVIDMGTFRPQPGACGNRTHK